LSYFAASSRRIGLLANCRSEAAEVGGDYYLQDDCYIIDGLKRVTAAKEVLKNGKHPKVGVVIHIDTTEAWETKRFEILNMNRATISPRVVLRNQMTENAAIKILYELNNDRSFVLEGRVSWDQNMTRGQFIRGETLLKAGYQLHRRPGLVLHQVGHVTLEENVKTFWEVIDECFNVRGLDITNSAPYIKDGF
jgi:hypothetical protein